MEPIVSALRAQELPGLVGVGLLGLAIPGLAVLGLAVPGRGVRGPAVLVLVLGVGGGLPLALRGVGGLLGGGGR